MQPLLYEEHLKSQCTYLLQRFQATATIFCFATAKKVYHSDNGNLVWSQVLTFSIACFMEATEWACSGRRANKADMLGRKSKPQFLAHLSRMLKLRYCERIKLIC